MVTMSGLTFALWVLIPTGIAYILGSCDRPWFRQMDKEKMYDNDGASPFGDGA